MRSWGTKNHPISLGGEAQKPFISFILRREERLWRREGGKVDRKKKEENIADHHAHDDLTVRGREKKDKSHRQLTGAYRG